METEYPPTALESWRQLRALTYDRAIDWLLTRVLTPLAAAALRIATQITTRLEKWT